MATVETIVQIGLGRTRTGRSLDTAQPSLEPARLVWPVDFGRLTPSFDLTLSLDGIGTFGRITLPAHARSSLPLGLRPLARST